MRALVHKGVVEHSLLMARGVRHEQVEGLLGLNSGLVVAVHEKGMRGRGWRPAGRLLASGQLSRRERASRSLARPGGRPG